jgi:hypothetical protein
VSASFAGKSNRKTLVARRFPFIETKQFAAIFQRSKFAASKDNNDVKELEKNQNRLSTWPAAILCWPEE